MQKVNWFVCLFLINLLTQIQLRLRQTQAEIKADQGILDSRQILRQIKADSDSGRLRQRLRQCPYYAKDLPKICQRSAKVPWDIVWNSLEMHYQTTQLNYSQFMYQLWFQTCELQEKLCFHRKKKRDKTIMTKEIISTKK